MEQRKIHPQAQLQFLNNECDITNDLLNKLKQVCSNHVNQIDNKNFQVKSTNLVAILKFQSESIQKLMEWNIGLEKFLAEMGPADLSHFTLMNGANNAISSEYQNSLPVTWDSGEPAAKATVGIVDLYDRYFGVKNNSIKNESIINSDKVEIYKNTEIESMLPLNDKGVGITSSSEKGGNISLDKAIKQEPTEIAVVRREQKEINESFDASLSIDKVLVQNDTYNESIATFDHFRYTSSSDDDKNLLKVNYPSYGKFYSDLEENIRTKKLFFKETPEPNVPKIGDICTIGFVETPSEIYIKLINTNNSLDVLSKQLFEEYQRAPIINAPNKIAARQYGNFWINHFKNVSCRVEVIDWLLHWKGNAVEVHMIDYGVKRWVNYNYLKVLNTKLKNIPRMAHLCHLGHLYPPGSTREVRKQTWPHEVNNKFYEILGNLNKTYYKIVRVWYCKQRKSYDIDLIKTDEEEKDTTIGQLLIDSKVAIEIYDDNCDSCYM